MQKTKSLAAKVRDLRAAAKAASAATASMLRTAGKTNPEKMARCWAAEQRVRNASKRA